MSIYKITRGLGSTLERHQWTIAAASTTAAMAKGQWVYQNAAYEAIVSPAASTTVGANHKDILFPVISGSEAPDSDAVNGVAVGKGAHEAITDGYEVTPAGARPAWAKDLPIVIVAGVITTYLAASDDESNIKGTVIEVPASGLLKVRINA